MWCPVLPPPRTSWPGRRWVRPAVRRSRGRWPAGPAADGGRWPGSDGAGAERRTVGLRLRKCYLEDLFLSLCLCLVPSTIYYKDECYFYF